MFLSSIILTALLSIRVSALALPNDNSITFAGTQFNAALGTASTNASTSIINDQPIVQVPSSLDIETASSTARSSSTIFPVPVARSTASVITVGGAPITLSASPSHTNVAQAATETVAGGVAASAAAKGLSSGAEKVIGTRGVAAIAGIVTVGAVFVGML
jgi:hypothetical protein